MAFHRAVKSFVRENPDVYDPRKILGPAKEELKKVIADKMRMFGSAGMALR